MTAFMYRLMGAAMLDAGTYEQVEHDRRANGQALLVVLLASGAAGLGVRLEMQAGVAGFAQIAALSLVGWIAWAVLALQIGSRVLPQRDTHADTGEMMRALGFAAAPGILLIFGMIPTIRIPVFTITLAWMFAAMVVALQHALDYKGVGRALAVCAVAALIVVAFTLGLGLLLTRDAG